MGELMALSTLVMAHATLSIKKHRKHTPANWQLYINVAKFGNKTVSRYSPDVRVELTVREDRSSLLT